MGRSSRSKRELRNRRIRKEITDGIRRKQLEDICKKMAEKTGVIAGNSEADLQMKKEEEEKFAAENGIISMDAIKTEEMDEEEVAGVITIDENTPVDASMFRPTVIGASNDDDDEDVKMKIVPATSNKNKKKSKSGNKKGGKKLPAKKKGIKGRK